MTACGTRRMPALRRHFALSDLGPPSTEFDPIRRAVRDQKRSPTSAGRSDSYRRKVVFRIGTPIRRSRPKADYQNFFSKPTAATTLHNNPAPYVRTIITLSDRRVEHTFGESGLSGNPACSGNFNSASGRLSSLSVRARKRP